MVEVSHRRFKCTCGYENDRDVIAVVNLNGRVSLTPSIAPQRCKPGSMRGNLAIWGGEEVRS